MKSDETSVSLTTLIPLNHYRIKLLKIFSSLDKPLPFAHFTIFLFLPYFSEASFLLLQQNIEFLSFFCLNTSATFNSSANSPQTSNEIHHLTFYIYNRNPNINLYKKYISNTKDARSIKQRLAFNAIKKQMNIWYDWCIFSLLASCSYPFI